MDQSEQEVLTPEQVKQEVTTLLAGLGPPQGPLSATEATVVRRQQHLLIEHELISGDMIKHYDKGKLMQFGFSPGVAAALQKAFAGILL